MHEFFEWIVNQAVEKFSKTVEETLKNSTSICYLL